MAKPGKGPQTGGRSREVDPARRRLLGLGISGIAGGLATGWGGGPLIAADGAKNADDPHRRDVVFLLDELEKAAGHFFEVKGIEWSEVRREFLKAVDSVKSDPEHVALCWRLLCRLRDGHAQILDPKVQPPDPSEGRRFTGPGVHLVTIGKALHVRRAFGAAANEGVEAGMQVEAIDGTPAAEWLKAKVEELWDDHAYSTRHAAEYAACHHGLAGWEGTEIRLELSGSRGRRRVKLARQGGSNFIPVGPVFPPDRVERVGRQHFGRTADGFGYIHLRDVPGELPAQLDEMLGKLGEVPGLILDCRANGGGGCDHNEVFGRFVPSGTQWRQYASAGATPFGGPMVVIVDGWVRSAGETVAGQFKEDGRAFMIGDAPTSGSSSQKTRLPVPSGLFTAYFSVASNKRRFNEGRGIEGIGVPPHETVPYDPDDLAAGVDTQIRQAAEILKKGIPRRVVPYDAGA